MYVHTVKEIHSTHKLSMNIPQCVTTKPTSVREQARVYKHSSSVMNLSLMLSYLAIECAYKYNFLESLVL